MAKTKNAPLNAIEIDAEEIVPPAATGVIGESVIRAGRPPKAEAVEPFQLRIPGARAREIRVEAAKRGITHSDLLMEAWTLWQSQNQEDA